MAWKYWPLTATQVKFMVQRFYRVATELHDGRRQRWIICGQSTRQPASNFPWLEGTITSVTDNGDGTISFTANDTLGSPIDWAAKFAAFALLTNAAGHTYAPAQYQIGIFPKDDPDATGLAEPNDGIALVKLSHDSTYLKVTDNGKFILNGKTLASYNGKPFEVIRYESSGPGRGDFWFKRYPAKPNDPQYDHGIITASTTTSITDDRTFSGAIGSTTFQCPKSSYWPAKLKTAGGAWREIITYCGVVIRRIRITGCDVSDPTKPKPTFAAQDVYGNPITTAPSGWYAIVDPGAFFRAEFRHQFARALGRKGYFWTRADRGNAKWSTAGSPPYDPTNYWTGSYTNEARLSHEPATDTLTSVPHFVDTISLAFDTGTADFTVFDVDGRTEVDATPFEDRLYGAFQGWSIRGEQLENCSQFASANWIEDKPYDGATAIPLLVPATWARLFAPYNTVTSSISSITTGVATIAAVTMPKSTPWEGAYASLPCTWALLKADDDVKKSGNGILTANTLTADALSFDDTPTTGDLGLRLVIAFGNEGTDLVEHSEGTGLTRQFESRCRLLVPRIYWMPGQDDDGNDVVPPTALVSGTWNFDPPSTNRAIYNPHGVLEETGPVFKARQAYRYTAGSMLQPTTDLEPPVTNAAMFRDISYQGLPNVVAAGSTFPRWEGSALTGTVTKVGVFPGGFWIEDSTQTWELSSGGVVTALGSYTETSTGTDTTVSATSWASDLTFTTPGVLDVLLPIIEASNDGSVTWEPRAPTAYDPTTQTFTVPAFSFNTSGKPIRFKQPGYIAGRGCLGHVMKGWRIKFTSADGTKTGTITIFAGDRRRQFCMGTLVGADGNSAGFTVAAGCTYEIQIIPPGSVVQYRPAHVEAVNGMVTMENAIQDDRGQNWHVGSPAKWLENRPTIVTDYGLFRVGDIWASVALNLEKFWADDVLRAIRVPVTWTSRLDPAIAELNSQTVNSGGPESSAGSPSANESAMYTLWGTSSPDTEHDTAPPFISANNANFSYPDLGGFAVLQLSSQCAYCVLSAPTGLKHRFEVWGKGMITGLDPDDGSTIAGVRYEFDPSLGLGYRSFGKLLDVTTQDGTIKHLVGTNPPARPTFGASPSNGELLTTQKGAVVDVTWGVVRYNVADGGLTKVSQLV